MALPWILPYLAVALFTAVTVILLDNNRQKASPHHYQPSRSRSPPPPYSKIRPPRRVDNSEITWSERELWLQQQTSQDTDRNSICDICLELVPSESRWSLTCGHRFHETCLQNYLLICQMDEHCPICKEGLQHRSFDIKPSGNVVD